MKRIILIAEDFISLETEKLIPKGRRLTSGQYSEPYDCPIARACKRMGLENISVSPYSINHSKGEIFIEGTSIDVGRVAHSIANGAKWGAIKVV